MLSVSAFTAILLLLSTPWLSSWLFRLVARSVGQFLCYKCSPRRNILLASADGEKLRGYLKQPNRQDADDEDDDDDANGWEEIDGAIGGAAPNGLPASDDWKGLIGFLHPFWFVPHPTLLGVCAISNVGLSNAGGGGERVLWAAIRAIQDRWPHAVCVVYTGDHDAPKEAIIQRVVERFNIALNPHTLHFLYLSTRHYVLASTWPRFTLLGQSLGSLVLALDAFNLVVPDIYIDTMGYAFTLALSKLLFPLVPTAAYVHYPTISTDMFVSLNQSAGSGQGLHAGAGLGWRGQVKRRYWQLFISSYSRLGYFIDVVMTNSSWTRAHIQELWGPARQRRPMSCTNDISLLFPPVAVENIQDEIQISQAAESCRKSQIIYIAQFRPEKNHGLILAAFADLVKSRSWHEGCHPRLLLVGSVRDRDDAGRVYKLRLDAHELQIKDHVDFICNATWPQVLAHLRSSSIGVNGMWNEHFGIGVVEYQASGLISVVNDSGGPKMDIVVDVDGGCTGFHASSVGEYAAAFATVLQLTPSAKLAMRQRARKSAQRFTQAVFAQQWLQHMQRLINLQRAHGRIATDRLAI